MSGDNPVDLPLFENLPKRKVKKGLLAKLEYFKKLQQETGGLVPYASAALLMEVSKQRVDELVKEGTLTPYEALGKKWLSAKQIADFVVLNREPGRPWKQPSVKELWRSLRGKTETKDQNKS
jgi:hypothetical protein